MILLASVVTRTVSITIYDDVQAFSYSIAHQTALALLEPSACA